MKVVFVTEARFTKNENAEYYGNVAFNRDLWARYLESFSEIIVMARVKFDADFVEHTSKLSSGKNISFIDLPYYIGPFQYLLNLSRLKAKIKQTVHNLNAVFICRVPGNISDLTIKYLIKENKEFGLEVVGDPWDVFASGSIQHPLRTYFRRKSYNSLKYNVQNATAVLYVTNKTLQERYPASPNTFQISASNVKITDDLIADHPKIHSFKKEYQLISIGSLDQMYKAPDILIKATKKLRDEGLMCNLLWLGDGKFKNDMEMLAKELSIESQITFAGNVSKEQVQLYLEKSDLFVLASRTEGLPRAVIEAMAIGLPCIGTDVGGIPELLSKEVLVQKNDVNALVTKIASLIRNPDFYNTQAKLNVNEAHNYKEEVLTNRRKKFYQHLINLKD